MSRHARYYAPRAVPCECGSTESYWHGEGESETMRVYCCDQCWKTRNAKPARGPK